MDKRPIMEQANPCALVANMDDMLRDTLTKLAFLMDECKTEDPLTMARIQREFYRALRLSQNFSCVRTLGIEKMAMRNEDLSEICEELCIEAADVAADNGVALSFEGGCMGHRLALNRPMIERLLLNLISNALIATPAGGEITVSLRRLSANIVMTVKDTGCGIGAEELQTLFQRYNYTALTDAPHGMGLGLAICRAVAEGHGGKIIVTSTPGKGTTVTVSFPDQRTEEHVSTGEFVPLGGFNRILVELADALPASQYESKYLD